MKSVAFPACCGINLMVNFGHTDSAIYRQNPSKEEVQAFINNETKYSGQIQMIVLNSEQLRRIKRITFKELGFKIKPLGLYKGHMNKLYVLTRNPNDN